MGEWNIGAVLYIKKKKTLSEIHHMNRNREKLYDHWDMYRNGMAKLQHLVIV